MGVNHGTLTSYNRGCRCDPCRLHHNEYVKRNRQAKNAEKRGAANVTPLREVKADTSSVEKPAPSAGPVESGILAEIDGLSTAESRQGLVQIALALARVLDNPVAIAQHPSAAHRLSETLDKIRAGADRKQSKLAAVRQMTRTG